MDTKQHELGRTETGKVQPLTRRVIVHRYLQLSEDPAQICSQLNIPYGAVLEVLHSQDVALATLRFLTSIGDKRLIKAKNEKVC